MEPYHFVAENQLEKTSISVFYFMCMVQRFAIVGLLFQKSSNILNTELMKNVQYVIVLPWMRYDNHKLPMCNVEAQDLYS